MSKNHQLEVLLKEHEEIVNLYIHQKKIEWNLITVYVAFNMGLAGAVATLFKVERMWAIVFLCLLGFLFSLGGLKLYENHKKQTSRWIQKGIEVENTLKEFVTTPELFRKCETLEEKPKIKSGMLVLTMVWLIAIVWTFLLATGWIDLARILY